MAEAAAETAPNGKTSNEVDEGVKRSVIEGSSAAGKGVGDMKPCVSKGVREKVVETGATTNEAAEEVVAKETADAMKQGGVEPMKEDDVKASAVLVKGESKNVAVAEPDTNAKKELKPKDVAKDEMEIDTKADSQSVTEPKKAVVEEEEKREAMDIDDKKHEKSIDEKAPTLPKEEQKAGVVLNPKKKMGRPRKSKPGEKTEEVEPMEGEEPPIEETKKRRRQKKEPVTPKTLPARERKSIERFVASTEKGKKELIIKQGSGTPLMDIPNVAYKLSKRAKGDEILNMLHLLLYNKRAKANVLKYNIFRFSGYVWGENQEKEKNKVKDKLERYTKEGLGQLIDVLDLHLPKTGKKEELVVKVLEFLESPHKTTEVSVEEKELKLKEKKRKSRTPGRGRGSSAKKRKLDDTPSKKRGRRKKNESDEDMEDDYPNSDDESLEEEEEVERKRLTFKDEDEEEQEDDDDDDDEDYEAKQKPQKKPAKSSKAEVQEADEEKHSNEEEESEGDQATKKSSAKSTPIPSVRLPKASSPDITRSSSKPPDKVYTKGSRKKNKELKEKEEKEKEMEREKEREKQKEMEVPEKKRRGKEKEKSKEKNPSKAPSRGRGRGKAKETTPKKKKNGDIPSDEVLQNEIRDLLKDLSPADFSKVTFMDIVIQLEEKFHVDLSVKKAHVKLLIRQEVSRLAEEGEEEEEEDGDQEGTGVDGEPPETDAAQAEEAADEEATDTNDAAAKAQLADAAEVSKDSDSVSAEEAGDASEEAGKEEATESSEAADAPVKTEQSKGTKKVAEQQTKGVKGTSEGEAAGD